MKGALISAEDNLIKARFFMAGNSKMKIKNAKYSMQ